MASLALPSLEVQGFRGFQDLRIEKLGRVNLIVGKNNIGKSSLLEAIRLYAATDIQRSLWQILKAHDEIKLVPNQKGQEWGSGPFEVAAIPQNRYVRQTEDVLSSLKYLFYGRKDITGPTNPIKIGPIDNPEQQVRISLDLYTSRIDEERKKSGWQILPPEELITAESPPVLRFSISLGKTFTISYPLDTATHARPTGTGLKEINVISIEASGLGKWEIAELWDSIALTDDEQEVLKALRIVAPGIEGIGIVSSRDSTCIVKVKGIREPIPIRSLGDGMQRMLGIALALVNAQNGILLIDEIENGLHYLIQEDLWRIVFQIAHRLNVQVFATTHSWDCITAFQEAAQAEEGEEGVLIRLEYKKDNIVATIFDKRKLAIATRAHIEVR